MHIRQIYYAKIKGWPGHPEIELALMKLAFYNTVLAGMAALMRGPLVSALRELITAANPSKQHPARQPRYRITHGAIAVKMK